MKMSITKNRNLIRYVHYGIALVIVLICTMTACKKKEHAPLTHQQSTGSSNRLTITGFSPTYGIEGITHTITITGTNFSNTAADNIISTGITLPGIGPIVIHTTHASPTSLKADVYLPPGSGGNSATLSISVKGKPDVAMSPSIFTITKKGDPIITDVSPRSVMQKKPHIHTIIIEGTNFSSNTNENKVTIGGIEATITHATSTALTVLVPDNAKTGKITVQTHLRKSPPTDFEFVIMHPVAITSAKTTGYTFSSSMIEITGEDFYDPSVTVCGIPAKITSMELSKLTVVVPNPKHETITGNIVITANETTAELNNFTIYPKYNKHDLEQVVNFFEQPSGAPGKTNAEMFDRVLVNFSRQTHSYSYDNPASWIDDQRVGIEFEIDAKYNKKLIIFRINDAHLHAFGKRPYSGALNLKSCSKLNEVDLSGARLTSIDLTGASPDLKLQCRGNDLTSIRLSHSLKYEKDDEGNNYINPQRSKSVVTPTIEP